MAELSADDQLGDDLAEFYSDPLGYVMYAFPWNTEPSIQQILLAEGVEEFLTDNDHKRQAIYRARFPNCEFGPDLWACDFLEKLGQEIRLRKFDGRHGVPPIRFATVSGHGIGKSALTAWLVKFILDTRPLSVGTVTAMTAEQLKSKTWAEVGKWHKMSLTSHWFDYTSGRGSMALTSNRLNREGNSMKETWKCTAQTCKEENSESFAGQHAASATSFYIFDEASGVPNKIFEVRDGGTTDGEPMVFDFGNGTRNSGRFFEECKGRLEHRYIVTSIDSRTVAITGKELYEEWISDFGVDSDYVKVRVRGMFPSVGTMQFMSTGAVEQAMLREAKVDRGAPLIIGVDVARFGDDEAVVYPRIGYDARSFAPTTEEGRYRGLDTNQLVDKVIQCVWRFRNMGIETDAIFVDTTGSAGVADNLRHLGYPAFDVNFGSGPTDKKTYRFKSDEIWGRMRASMGKLMLPFYDDPTGVDLKTQLTQREFGYTVQGNKIHLEPKKDMKARLGGQAASPDIADALACTFALEVAPKTLAQDGLVGNHQQVISEFDPLDINRETQLKGFRHDIPARYSQSV